ncbi:hypothetical protein P4O66_013913 [Electrophorus voltai]|uniref:HECT domain-containing protein n=1 Tax=Electrophorus voltai TaxID=2609070 RepID=A0AAD8Z3S4_9TELE|nr:hypothetical protein P4O66_013913 [Electrophorus voltai]
MSCGRNSKGQLGRAKSKDTKFPVIEGLGGVEAVACGQEHSLALCESGQVFSWGGGEEGQLGVISSVAKCTKPEANAYTISSQTDSDTIALTNTCCAGCLWSLSFLGSNKSQSHLTQKTLQNCLKGGEVFAWGQNKYGQLGLGKAITMQATPALVRALTGVPVTRVAAGGAHTLALALPAQVFCCGANSAGQLGLKRTDEKGRFSVCAVPALRNMAITSISCGAEHTAVLTKAGEVYTFGDGAHGQLGHNSTDKELLPRKVKGIDAPAKEVTCGSHHTLVLTASGILLAFGRGVKGQMENGCTEDGLQPIKLEGSWNKLAAAKHAGADDSPLEHGDLPEFFNKFKPRRLFHEGLMNIIPLVHNLLYAAPFMRCPEVFLLLPTCPILHEEHNAINLVLPLAVAITNLNESATKTLQEHWCSMEAPMMTKHICMWKQALAFLLKSMVWLNYTPGVNALLEVLKCLYKANKKAQHQRKVAFSEFYIEEIGNTPLLLQKDVTLWRQINWGLVQEVEGTCALFCRYPFLLDLQSKINVFNYVADITKVMHQVIHESVRAGGFPQYTLTGETPTPVLQLKLRRTALLEDTFRQLSSTDHYNFRKELLGNELLMELLCEVCPITTSLYSQVQFAEDSKLTDVNKRDFFLHAFTELVDPDSRMFIYNDTQTLVWFPAKPNIESKRYFLLGILCGMALYNGTIVHMPFPLAMFKKLVNAKANLEDLMEFSPVLGERLRYLLHDYTDDDAEKMELTFHVSWDGADVELVPHGKEKLVTSANKKEFVNAYVDYILNKSVEKVFEEFQRGFYKVCDRDVVEFFQPEELRGVLVGSEDYDWDTFKKNTVYSGMFHEKHPTIVTFWEVFEELTDKQKKAFLSHGKNLIGFIRGDGNVSVMKLHIDGEVKCGKLKSLDLKKAKIRVISCGEDHALLLAYGGNVLFMDKSNVCRPVRDLSGRNVIQIACGDQHFMALTNDGQLFTWGQNSSGQLGLGKGEPSSVSPQPLKSLCGIPLAQISAGGDHSFALSLSGAVFGWGRNSAGQLGLGDCEDRYFPTCVSNLSKKKTVFIACGEEHTATLSKGGTVFTFGLGRYGQLGHNSFRDELCPRVVAELWGSKVSQISCGRHHTLALVGSSKTIYSFGCGEQGQLGNGQRTNQCVPLPVCLPPEANQDHKIEKIIAGGKHSFVLCSLKESEDSSVNAEPKQRKKIVTLGEGMINRWVCKRDSNISGAQRKAIKNCDGHYETSTNVSGLDLESVRTAFEQIAERANVLLEVQKVVEKALLPSLGSATAGVEALRIYLILPELLRVLNQGQSGIQLTVEVASAILKLSPHLLMVLENYWSELPDCFLKTLVELFRNVSANLISQMTNHRQGKFFDKSLKKTVKVLQIVHKAASRRQREITSRDFVIHEINHLFEMLEVVKDDLHAINQGLALFINPLELDATKQYLEHTLQNLISSPCIFNLEAKCNLLNSRAVWGLFRLELRRTALLEDCFRQLRTASELQLKLGLQVVYQEKFEQSDVNKRDFFHKAFQMLREPSSGMFMYNDTKSLWFPPEPGLQEEKYFVFGILCGLAFYNNSRVGLPFPLALFKKLLGIKPSVEDLVEFSPVLAKKEFVNAYMDYILNKSVEKVFEEFQRGFYKVCDRDVVGFFQPEELRGVLVGSEDYDWDTFKKNTSYEGFFHARHPTIVSFWEVFDELSDNHKRNFLLFLTGFDRVPILGMDQVKMRVRPMFNSTQEHLPQALTCHAILDLPMYQTRETLRTKLTEALNHKRGFWEE